MRKNSGGLGKNLSALIFCLSTILIPACHRSGTDAENGEVAAPPPIGMNISTASEIRVLPPQFLFDPQVTVFDAAAPSWLFNNRGGSLIPGKGWTPVSTDGGYFSFVEGGKGELRFLCPDNHDLGLFCRVRGIPSEKGRKQQMTIILNGHSERTVTLKSTISDYRIKLSPSSLIKGINKMELSFKYSTVEAAKNDPREVSAAFWALAVIPNHIPDPYAFIHPGGLDRKTGKLRITDGEQIKIPVAPHHQFTFEFGKVNGSTGELEVVVDINAGITGGEWAEIWRGPPEELSGKRLTVTNSSAEIGKMRFLVHSPGTDLAIAGAFVEISFGPNALMDSPWKIEHYEAWRKTTNVFMYLVDALRADRLGSYGGSAELNPNFTAFGCDATVYTHAESSSSWTLPSVASFLSGYPPLYHQMMTGNIRMTWEHLNPLGLRLAAEGMDSIGISQSFVVGPAFGFDQAFGDFIYNTQLSGRELRSDDLRGFLRQALLNKGSFSKPLFAYLHTVGSHAPYSPPPEYSRWVDPYPGKLTDEDYLPGFFSKKNYGADPAELAHIKALYDAEIAYEDAAFGHFIDMLKFFGVYDTSLIIFLSDHGEEFYDHGGFDHGQTLYEELSHVPLIIRYPGGLKAGQRITRRISTAQIPATIGEVLGKTWDGPASAELSISPGALAGREKTEPPLFAEVHQAGSASEGAIAYNAVWEGSQKCLFSQAGINQFGKKEAYLRVYDLDKDPEELHPEVIEDGSDLACWGHLRDWVDNWVEKRERFNGEGDVTIDEGIRDQMKALGYLQ